MPKQGPLAAFDAVVTLASSSAFAPHIAHLRSQFEARTGTFTADDPWFEARSRAFWDDAVTSDLIVAVADSLDPNAQRWANAFARAHRGLFFSSVSGEARTIVDVWSGAEFVLHAVSDGVGDALDASNELFDARVVAMEDPVCVAMLPGAYFHPADATDSIVPILGSARTLGLSTTEVLDALLRMERRYRGLSRMKASYSYRPEALSADDSRQRPR